MVVEKCPSCSMSLRLFVPRDALRHINDCLDNVTKAVREEVPLCAVCNRDLTSLTTAARQEHVNRCLDQTTQEPPRQPVLVPTRPQLPVDPALKDFLAALGLSRYAERFAKEEIDLDALRLLTDEELVALKLPDVAKRHIADALTNVDLLRTIAGDKLTQVETTTGTPKATQKLPPSRMKGTKQLAVDDESDDDEFAGLYEAAHSPPPLAPSSKFMDYEFDDVHDDPPSPPLHLLIADSKDVTDEHSNIGTSTIENEVRIDEGSAKETSVNWDSKHSPRQKEKSQTQSGQQKEPKEESSPVLANDAQKSCVLCAIEPAPYDSLEKLEKWQKDAVEKESRRHKRRLERIDEEYRRLRQKIDTSAPVDLTLDDSPVPTPKASSPNRTVGLDPVLASSSPAKVLQKRSKTWISGITPGTKRDRKETELGVDGNKLMKLRKSWKSDLVEDDSDESVQENENDSRNRSSFSANGTSLATKPIYSNLEKSSDDDEDFLEMSFSQRVAAKCNRTQNEVIKKMGGLEGKKSLCVSSIAKKKDTELEVEDDEEDEDEDVMDLTQKVSVDKLNSNPIQLLVDMHSRESVQCMSSRPHSQTKEKGSRLKLQRKQTLSGGRKDEDDDDVLDLTQKVEVSKMTQTRQKKSRLKKAPRCTSTEIRAAIRADEKLYDDVLSQRMVDFQRFMQVAKTAGLKISMAKLDQFLKEEGLSVRANAQASNQSTQYFKNLCIAEMQY